MKNLVLAFALLATSASAQETPKVSTSIYCFKYAKGLEDVFVQTGAKKFTKVELSTANMLGPIGVVSEDGNITVRREEIDDEGKATYPAVGKVSLRGLARPLIVLFPGGEDDPLPYRGVTIDRSEASFPMGSYKFMNLSPHPMRGLVGKDRVDARPGEVKELKPQGQPGEMRPVRFEFHDGDNWRTMTETRWVIRDDRRSLLCAFLDPDSNRVKMRSIPERLVPVDSEE